MPSLLKHLPEGFSIDLASELAQLIVAAYDQFKPPAGSQSKWPLAHPHQVLAEFSAQLAFHDTETFGFVSRRHDTGIVYVTFRGTESPEDWLINVAVKQVAQHHKWGNVEDGFARVYSQCASTIIEAIRGAAPSRVIVTGHSMGGALATLCAADIRGELGLTTTVYTFASPRVGDPAFADQFNLGCPDTWRVANTEDLITNVPPSTSALDSRHRGLLDSLLHFFDRLPMLSSWVRHRLGWTGAWQANAVYEHIGTPVNFTKNNGTVIENHVMSTYLAAIPKGSDPIAPSKRV
jgi:triacylglycerol lipase